MAHWIVAHVPAWITGVVLIVVFPLAIVAIQAGLRRTVPALRKRSTTRSPDSSSRSSEWPTPSSPASPSLSFGRTSLRRRTTRRSRPSGPRLLSRESGVRPGHAGQAAQGGHRL